MKDMYSVGMREGEREGGREGKTLGGGGVASQANT